MIANGKQFSNFKQMKNILVSFIFFSQFQFFSQKNISNQNHSWIIYNGNHKLYEKFGIHTEYQWRREDWYKNWQQSLMRLGLDYYVNSSLSATVGYGWIVTFPYGEQPITHEFQEHRIWEQINLKSKYGRFEIQHRYRLEQRFLENWIASNGGNYTKSTNLFRQRIRYRFMVQVPLTKKEMTDNTLFLNINDEPFIGFGKGIGKNIVDQNRFIAALGWRFNKEFNIQLGYLNQFVVKPDGVRMERNHTLWLSTTMNFDLTKK